MNRREDRDNKPLGSGTILKDLAQHLVPRVVRKHVGKHFKHSKIELSREVNRQSYRIPNPGYSITSPCAEDEESSNSFNFPTRSSSAPPCYRRWIPNPYYSTTSPCDEYTENPFKPKPRCSSGTITVPVEVSMPNKTSAEETAMQGKKGSRIKPNNCRCGNLDTISDHALTILYV